MVEGWKEYKINEIASIHNTKRIPLNSRQRSDMRGSIPYYGASGIVDHINDFIFDGTYVLISEDGENLRSRKTPIAFKAKGKFWVNNHAHILKGKESHINDWIIYILENMDLNPYISGAVQPKLNKNNLLKIPFTLPPIPEQKAIASILSAIDDKIELNLQMNKTLEEMAMTLYKHWFVDFGPFKDGRFVESELGVIPEGWEVGTLKDLVTIFKTTYKPQEHPDNLFIHYSLPSFDNGKYPSSEMGNKIKSNKTLLNSNRILVSKLNPRFPRIWTVYYSFTEYISFTSPEFINYEPIEYSDWSYINCLFRDKKYFRQYTSHATGSTGSRQRVSPNITLDFLTLLPEKSSRYSFNEKVSHFYKRIEENILENIKLKELRKILLPKLISGQVRLKEFQQKISGAL